MEIVINYGLVFENERYVFCKTATGKIYFFLRKELSELTSSFIREGHEITHIMNNNNFISSVNHPNKFFVKKPTTKNFRFSPKPKIGVKKEFVLLPQDPKADIFINHKVTNWDEKFYDGRVYMEYDPGEYDELEIDL